MAPVTGTNQTFAEIWDRLQDDPRLAGADKALVQQAMEEVITFTMTADTLEAGDRIAPHWDLSEVQSRLAKLEKAAAESLVQSTVTKLGTDKDKREGFFQRVVDEGADLVPKEADFGVGPAEFEGSSEYNDKTGRVESLVSIEVGGSVGNKVTVGAKGHYEATLALPWSEVSDKSAQREWHQLVESVSTLWDNIRGAATNNQDDYLVRADAGTEVSETFIPSAKLGGSTGDSGAQGGYENKVTVRALKLENGRVRVTVQRRPVIDAKFSLENVLAHKRNYAGSVTSKFEVDPKTSMDVIQDMFAFHVKKLFKPDTDDLAEAAQLESHSITATRLKSTDGNVNIPLGQFGAAKLGGGLLSKRSVRVSSEGLSKEKTQTIFDDFSNNEIDPSQRFSPGTVLESSHTGATSLRAGLEGGKSVGMGPVEAKIVMGIDFSVKNTDIVDWHMEVLDDGTVEIAQRVVDAKETVKRMALQVGLDLTGQEDVENELIGLVSGYAAGSSQDAKDFMSEGTLQKLAGKGIIAAVEEFRDKLQEVEILASSQSTTSNYAMRAVGVRLDPETDRAAYEAALAGDLVPALQGGKEIYRVGQNQQSKNKQRVLSAILKIVATESQQTTGSQTIKYRDDAGVQHQVDLTTVDVKYKKDGKLWIPWLGKMFESSNFGGGASQFVLDGEKEAVAYMNLDQHDPNTRRIEQHDIRAFVEAMGLDVQMLKVDDKWPALSSNTKSGLVVSGKGTWNIMNADSGDLNRIGMLKAGVMVDTTPPPSEVPIEGLGVTIGMETMHKAIARHRDVNSTSVAEFILRRPEVPLTAEEIVLNILADQADTLASTGDYPTARAAVTAKLTVAIAAADEEGVRAGLEAFQQQALSMSPQLFNEVLYRSSAAALLARHEHFPRGKGNTDQRETLRVAYERLTASRDPGQAIDKTMFQMAVGEYLVDAVNSDEVKAVVQSGADPAAVQELMFGLFLQLMKDAKPKFLSIGSNKATLAAAAAFYEAAGPGNAQGYVSSIGPEMVVVGTTPGVPLDVVDAQLAKAMVANKNRAQQVVDVLMPFKKI